MAEGLTAPRKYICPACGKEFGSEERRRTYLRIVPDGGFAVIKIVHTCSGGCRMRYEERVRATFKESAGFYIDR